MLKKLVFVFLLMQLFSFPVYSSTITGGIEYTVDMAREESFNNISTTIDIQQFKKYLIDPNYEKHKLLIAQNKLRYKNIRILVFSDGVYVIDNLLNQKETFYYYPNGSLVQVEILLKKGYPEKSVIYDNKGVLTSVSYCISSKEQFVFDLNKKLLTHWKGNNCYNEKGELIMTRESK